MKFYRSIIGISFIVIVSAGYVKKQDLPSIHIYITPRNVNYGWADMGVFKFPITRESVKVPYNKRSFTTSILKDSVFELFYTKPVTTSDLLNTLKRSHEDIVADEFLFPRILIILACENANDSLLVDNNYNVFYKRKVYKIDSTLKNYLINRMPPEIRDNWINNKMAR